MSEHQGRPVLPPDQHESIKAPRTLMAIVVVALFAMTVLLPYFQDVPSGAASNLILTSSETVKAIMLLVIGYYFGTTVGSAQKNAAAARNADAVADLAQTAKTAGAVLAANAPSADADKAITLKPGEEATVKATDDAAEDDPAMFGGPRT